MKLLYLFRVGMLAFILFLANCSKEKNLQVPTTGFSQDIQTIVTQPVIDTLRGWGMTIYEGEQPRNVTGIYLLSPDKCIYDNTPTQWAGQTLDDYKFRFTNQSSLTLTLDYKDVTNAGLETSSGNTGYLSGNGDSVTIFSKVTGNVNGVNYHAIIVVSGIHIYTNPGEALSNFKWSLYMKDKDPDPNGNVMQVGGGRIFIDDNGAVAKVDTY